MEKKPGGASCQCHEMLSGPRRERQKSSDFILKMDCLVLLSHFSGEFYGKNKGNKGIFDEEEIVN